MSLVESNQQQRTGGPSVVSFPVHDPRSLKCPPCAGRATLCPCGGVVHVLEAGGYACSNPRCDQAPGLRVVHGGALT